MRIYKRKKIVERIILIGLIADRSKMFDWCCDNGYKTIRSGPKPLRLGYVSRAKFKIVAEKVIG